MITRKTYSIPTDTNEDVRENPSERITQKSQFIPLNKVAQVKINRMDKGRSDPYIIKQESINITKPRPMGGK